MNYAIFQMMRCAMHTQVEVLFTKLHKERVG